MTSALIHQLTNSPIHQLTNSTVSVSHHLEVALLAAFGPGAGDKALVCADVLQLAVDRVVHGLARGVLAVAFDVHAPRGGIERGLLDRDSFRPGIDVAGDRLAVPVHLEHDVRPIVFRRTPVAAPCPFQRVPELRQRRRGNQQRDNQTRYTTDRDSHRRSLLWSSVRSRSMVRSWSVVSGPP